MHINLVATLAMAQVIFLAGIDTSQDQVIKNSLNENNNILIMLGRDNHVDKRSVSYEVRVTSKICIIFEIIQSRQSRFLQLYFLIHSNLH